MHFKQLNNEELKHLANVLQTNTVRQLLYQTGSYSPLSYIIETHSDPSRPKQNRR